VQADAAGDLQHFGFPGQTLLPSHPFARHNSILRGSA
jgi:hypothetical protein